MSRWIMQYFSKIKFVRFTKFWLIFFLSSFLKLKLHYRIIAWIILYNYKWQNITRVTCNSHYYKWEKLKINENNKQRVINFPDRRLILSRMLSFRDYASEPISEQFQRKVSVTFPLGTFHIYVDNGELCEANAFHSRRLHSIYIRVIIGAINRTLCKFPLCR